jgi:hypothetical protein
MKENKQRILVHIEKSNMPLDVENIRKAAGIGNWNTALKHCLELLVDGRINGQRTSKGWIFWPKREAKTTID